MSIEIEIVDRVATVTMNRPKALNALNSELSLALVEAATLLDKDPAVGCLVLTGSERAFCAGADIRELQSWRWPDNLQQDPFAVWDNFARLQIPKIAAVSGLALGGGCELALMCDFIYAAENARIGQPELHLGLIPGMGGTQRLVNRVGRAQAKEMVLTGAPLTAEEALRIGLVNRVIANDSLLKQAQASAAIIAKHPRTATRTANAALNVAEETNLGEGLQYERARYFALWATDDAREGMSSFLEKREPNFHP